MPRHTSRNRVDSVLDGDAPGFEKVGQFLDLVLCLCYRKAIPGREYYRVGISQYDGGIFSRDLYDWPSAYAFASRFFVAARR